uniref:Uncharacterized protein n=1 Tax=Arion vulgaris TaxID=1028688 RepID=A0A0B7A6I3_9EUPU
MLGCLRSEMSYLNEYSRQQEVLMCVPQHFLNISLTGPGLRRQVIEEGASVNNVFRGSGLILACALVNLNSFHFVEMDL